MAFHGGRGAPRGGFRSGLRGSSRPAGSRGSGGRGRGRGGLRGGKGRPIFDSARVTNQKEQAETIQSGSDSSDDEAGLSNAASSSAEDEEEPLPSESHYATLLKTFAIGSSVPLSKRRKIDHAIELEAKYPNQHQELSNLDDTDHVEEPEEGPETATIGLLEEEDNEPEDATDPFELHFADPEENVLAKRLEALNKKQWATRKVILPKVGRAYISGPLLPESPNINEPSQLKLKQKLAGIVRRLRPSFDPLEASIAAPMFDYQDVFYCERSVGNAENLRRLVCLHAVNHIFKTRDRVIKNNARLSKDENNDDLELRDQGFTRPKVLMILPTRESCVKMVNMITLLCDPEQQENRKRFDDSYSEPNEKFSEDKAEDFRELFGGNDDDMFRIGMKFTRKTVKYFSQFYNSDIIFASSLGLRMALEGKNDKKGDSDFLSSIELVIVDQADALLMQNWEHVEYIFEHLNLQPKEAHGCDFSRVRNWYLNDNAKYFRQTIAFSAFNTVDLNTMFYNQSKNWAGKIRINATYPGVLQELGIKVKQTFSRLEAPAYINEPDARFAYFTTAIIPTLTRREKDIEGTLIFIPSYLDFVRVRNYFLTSQSTSNLSFGSISEYTSVRDVTRARSHFFNARHSVLLYTERAHHFRRYQLRGVKKIIMYGLPENPVFYREIMSGYLGRSMQEGRLESGQAGVRVIFSKWDAMKLERIVGTVRVGKMTTDKGDTFDFL